MSGGDMGLGGPLKKNSAKGLDGKPLGGKPLAGKPLGDAAPAPAVAPVPFPAPSASAKPSAPLSFELDDAPAPLKKENKSEAKSEAKKAAPAFNPFADQAVAMPTAATPATPVAPTTNLKEKPGTGRIEKPAVAKSTKPAIDPADADIRPGTAKDLWMCPHCGAKNKPGRETCRECRKDPSEPVAIPWFKKPLVIGPVVGGVIVVVMVLMWLTSTDLGLHVAGVPDSKVRSAGTTHQEIDLGETREFSVKKSAAVSGRVIFTSDYGIAPWMTVVVLGLGKDASNDAAFSTWTAEFDGQGFEVKAPRYATLFLIFDGNKPTLKAGDYLSVVGAAGVAEQDNRIVLGTEKPNCWTIKVEKMEQR
jgi:hypothetical protein